MTLFSRHRSYTEKVLAARNRRKVLGRIALVILSVSFVRALFIQSYKVDSAAMQPTIAQGDRIASFPLPVGAMTLFGKLPPLSDVKRGELIIVAPDSIPTESWWFRIWDSVVRFFTFQRLSPSYSRYGKNLSSPGLYRVIGLPGDALRRNGSVYEIQPRDAAEFSSEFELSEARYSITQASASSRKDPARSFSSEYLLGAGEYFVACDDRSTLLGSPLWGPIGSRRIIGRVVAVFWPPRHMKIP